MSVPAFNFAPRFNNQFIKSEKMRTDIDLEFLQYCSNTELRELCDMLTHDEEGNIRFSEKLTEKDSYIENYPDNCKSLWKDFMLSLCF